MSKIFMSYRHVKPDQDLAHFLVSNLKERKHDLFVDTQMLVGTNWPVEIDRQIRASDFFIVLLSKESIRSDMVRKEVKLAHQVAQKKRLTILPIRVAFEGELPYDLGASLDQIHYAMWKPEIGLEVIGQQISAAIEGSVALPGRGKLGDVTSERAIEVLAQATEYAGAPLPAADPRLVSETGALRLGSPFYIRRKADDEVEEQIRRVSQTTIVKGMRQMGKSSLLARARALAEREQQKALYLDFQGIDDSHFESINSLLLYLAHQLARWIKAPVKPKDFWDDYLGKENITNYLEEVILREAGSPIVLLLDEADLVFKYPYRDDFFSTIRVWHNRRAIHDIWNKLSLVISHSTEPYLWIQDINKSPFNVGTRVKLEDFNFDEVWDLNLRLGLPLKTESDVRKLMRLVGGQPYLVRQALYVIGASRWTIAQLQKEALDDAGPFGDHLRRHLWSLQEQRKLKDALSDVLSHGSCKEEAEFQKLKAAGLVRGEARNSVEVRCKLYEDYFRKHL